MGSAHTVQQCPPKIYVNARCSLHRLGLLQHVVGCSSSLTMWLFPFMSAFITICSLYSTHPVRLGTGQPVESTGEPSVHHHHHVSQSLIAWQRRQVPENGPTPQNIISPGKGTSLRFPFPIAPLLVTCLLVSARFT